METETEPQIGLLDRAVEGKVMLITGASRGIGAHLADFFARRRAKLVLTARTVSDLERVAEEARRHTDAVSAIAGDLTDGPFVDELFERLRAEHGRLDVLVNNAGIYLFGPVEELSVQVLQDSLDINVVSPFRCLQNAIRLMKATTGTGKIITIGSVRSHWTEAGDAGAYNASKFGVHAMVDTIARQLHDEGSQIAVGMICPGLVQMRGVQGEDRGRIPQWVIGNAVLLAVAAPPWVSILDTVIVPTTQSPW